MFVVAALFSYHLVNQNDTPNVDASEINTLTFHIPNSATSDPVYSLNHPPGQYQIECFGGAGGSMEHPKWNAVGGKGGYASGIVNLPAGTLAIYVGGKGTSYTGTTAILKGGFNGGGDSCGSSAGGGFSAVTFEGDWIIGAGGGGGANDHSEGGSAVGLVGEDGEVSPISTLDIYADDIPGIGGSQVSAGSFGGNGHYGGSETSLAGDGGGGGGGYFGGGKGLNFGASGGAGSSYISGHPGCQEHPSIVFSDTVFGTHDGGNGYVRIKLLAIETCSFTKADENHATKKLWRAIEWRKFIKSLMLFTFV